MAGKKILLVEDDEEIRELIASFLLEENYIVVEAANGLEGVNTFMAQKPFDLTLNKGTITITHIHKLKSKH